MLAVLLKEHQQKQELLKQENEVRRKKAVTSVDKVSACMVDSVNIGVSKVFTNQKKIEVQAVQLQTQTERFSKQTAQWLQLIEGFNQSLKEIGDIESWARTIEADMRQIAANLEYVHRNTAMEEATAAGK
ncbi:GCN5 family protein 1 (GCN5L1) protein [Acanthamoeba castellanii str. Neff]|uniref:Biogenesis of lysosome-related organelles complex 1 subunit 1 n=1 Tax=Acanthamoeba castellanii (strain ATCC 30010 / Neff) TaxID=1257118 RepID=L8GKR3_ACACF|nr:GCN5 family protein 1 (GCN5L1) protein [Acanthamoeba castellanii str. Neff]ELR13645.1 GCN5 family protein 1 (GCN5L1) protein [Acanthamoeba castellanii str. Neff]